MMTGEDCSHTTPGAVELPQSNADPLRTTAFREDLEGRLNYWSMENGSNTPDFLLAEYLLDCLAAFDRCVNKREGWYGRDPAQLDGRIPESPVTHDGRVGMEIRSDATG